MIDDNEFQKYNIGSDELYLPLCNDDVNRFICKNIKCILIKGIKKYLQEIKRARH
jgi:hypothetical protein